MAAGSRELMRFEGPLEDRLAIRELCESYGDAVCRHDLKDYRALWIEDSEWSHPDVGQLRGLDAIAAAVGSAMAHYPQIVFISTPGSIIVRGERATGRDYTSELVTDNARKTYRMTGLYEDRYRKHDGQWFFQARHFRVLNVAAAADDNLRIAQDLLEREAVRDAVAAVSQDIDQRQWQPLRSLFADTVVVDYTSLFGGQPQTQDGDDLVGSWRKLLTPLSATQHLLGPIRVEVGERTATATCHVRACHYRKGLPGGDEWVVSGHYVFELGRDSTGWRIQKITFQFSYQTGNTRLLEEAASQPR